MSSKKPSVWRSGVGSAAVGAIANLAIYVAARAASVSFVIPSFSPGGEPVAIPAGQVVFVTLVMLLIGTAVAAFAQGRGRLPVVKWLAGVLGVVSLGAPLSLDVDTSTKLVLASMHIVAAATFVIALRRIEPATRGPVHTAPLADARVTA